MQVNQCNSAGGSGGSCHEQGTTAGFSTASRDQIAGHSATPQERLVAFTVLCHPRLDRIGELVLLGELTKGRPARLARSEPFFSPPTGGRSRPLDDPFLSRRPILLLSRSDGGIELRRNGSRSALVADGESLKESLSLPPEAIERGVVLELSGRIVLLLHRRPAPNRQATQNDDQLVGVCAHLEEIRAAIARLVDLDLPVLVRGESGTGKELVARALHQQGPRARKPFVAVNLAALPESLAAAELFGARKGAFTGAARDRQGYFERADGGTLFLDEVGEAPPEVQVLLLRALEQGEIFPLGSERPKRLDVRIVAATDADLESLIQADRFRIPLLHRLAGYTLHLEPLRKRRDDLGLLLLHFLRQEQTRLPEPVPAPAAEPPWLPAQLVAQLARYPWPGNVRELANIARRLVIDSRGRPTLATTAPFDDRSETAPRKETSPPPAKDKPISRRPSKITEEELVSALQAHRFNLQAAAQALGVSRTSLYYRIEQSPRLRLASEVPAEEIRRSHQRHDGDVEAMVMELEMSPRALRQRIRDLGLR